MHIQRQDFDHFVLTRFNATVDYGGALGLDPVWLSNRFDLFNRFCYPSVRAQSNQNFKWIVFFDKRTPEAFKYRVREYATWPNFVPVYVDGLLTDAVSRGIVAGHVKKASRYLITTRLDNDDAISRDLIKTVQIHFNGQEYQFVNFAHGYCWYNGQVYALEDLSNPFISLIEKIRTTTGEFDTVYCGSHTGLSAAGQVLQIDTRPAWIQVIHRGNVSNVIRGKKQPLERLGDDFAINAASTLPKQEGLSYWLDQGAFSWRLVRKAFTKMNRMLSGGIKT